MTIPVAKQDSAADASTSRRLSPSCLAATDALHDQVEPIRSSSTPRHLTEDALYDPDYEVHQGQDTREEELQNIEEWADLQDGSADITRFLNSIPQKSRHVITRWNSRGTRALRITQKELLLTAGNRIITSIEVIQTDVHGNVSVVFAVKHTHGMIWRRQSPVHKNLLMAAALADVECPIELPQDSIKLYQSVENRQHVQIYLERLIPHFRFRNLPKETSVFWWRAVGEGSLIFQNWETGKLIIQISEGKGIPNGIETLARGLSILQNMPASFWVTDPEYDRIRSANLDNNDNDKEVSNNLENEQGDFTTVEDVAETIQSWALEDGVSPWMTKLIVKSLGSRKGQIIQYRYSVGVDIHDSSSISPPNGIKNSGTRLKSAGTTTSSHLYYRNSVNRSPDMSEILNGQLPPLVSCEPNGIVSRQEQQGHNSLSNHLYSVFLSIQVHSNEPLSRELKAYPVCMIPVLVDTFDLKSLMVLYLKSLWFLRKLFEFHVEANKATVKEMEQKFRAPIAAALANPGYIRDYKHVDERDITHKSRLAGGARLTTASAHRQLRGM